MGGKDEIMKCEYCKKNILECENDGLLVEVEHIDTGNIDDVFLCCSGECYDFLVETGVGSKEVAKLRDINELKNPILFMQFIMDLMDRMYNGVNIDERIYDKFKGIIIRMSQHVLRQLSPEEQEEALNYNMSRI